MPKKGKKFIDKKKAISFHLVSRSQQDPLVADETAPQHVLVPIIKKENRNKRIEEQHKYGIYFDDDYNYLQHLKDTKDNRMEWPEGVEKNLEEMRSRIQLPSSVFASEVEEKVGMLNKAAPVSGPQLHLDPDVVAAMDEDFNYNDPDNQLEDNFIELADGVASDQEFDVEFDSHVFDERDEDGYISSDFDSDDMDVGSLTGKFSKEETKSRTTRYSLSSSVLPRNENLQLLDEQFEKNLHEYDDYKIGALDLDGSDDEETPVADALIAHYAEEYAKELEDLSKTHIEKDTEIIEKTKHLYYNVMDDEDEGEEFDEVPVINKKETSCQFTPARRDGKVKVKRSFIDGPNVISIPRGEKIKVSQKTGVPIDEINSTKLALKALDTLPGPTDTDGAETARESVISRLSQLSIRSKNETPEEKSQRKRLLREYRRERRIEKKINTLAFKEVDQQQARIAINNRKNVQGNRLL